VDNFGSLAGYLRMAGGPEQQQPEQQNFNDALAKLMTPDPNIEAMMGPQRRPPTLADTLGKQAQAYGQMPDGPMGMDPQGQTPTYNPLGPPQPGARGFAGGQVTPQPPQMMQPPMRGLR
jgi:hypothetical protein